MRRTAYWTIVLLIVFVFQIIAKAEMSSAEITSLRRKIATQKANCEKNQCKDLKNLKKLDVALKDLLKSKEALEHTKEENITLREQASILQKNLPLKPSKKGCQKKKILESKMEELGINENGSLIYSKRPIPNSNAQCWSNSRKKKIASVTLCEFPLAVNVLTKGGKAQDPTEYGVQYMFSLNGCDLVAVKITEENSKYKKEQSLSLKSCSEYWKKRCAEADMTKVQFEIMQETIQQCFKYGLLPADEKVIQSLTKLPGPGANSTH